MTPSPKPFPPRKRQHWINQSNSSGCEVQLWDRKYTIWLSNRNWKGAERDADTIIEALETFEGATALVEEARKKAFEEAAKEAESWFELFDFDSFGPRDKRRCANPNQIAARIRDLAKSSPSAGEKEKGKE